MFTSQRGAHGCGLAFAALLAASWFSLTTSLEFNICANINTASMQKNESIYQTNGLCHDFCINDYAYAITQENSCWCSNYAPAKSTQEDGDMCSTTCPAFPVEHCGGPGVFAYIEIDGVEPSGTQGGASPTPTNTQSEAETSTAPARVTETVQDTVTVSPSEPPTTSDSSSSSSPPTDDPSTTESASTSMVQTVTADGTVQTVTVGPTAVPTDGGTASNDTAGSSSSDGGGGLSKGGVAGVAVGVVAGVFMAAGALLLFFLRRRRQNKERAYQDDPSVRGSSAGMMGGSHRPDMSMSNRSGGAPASPNSAGNRSSMLQIDPRMDPFKQGLYMRSGSHESVNTLRDDHDYSRRIHPPKVLRATNPDPEGADND